MSNEFNSIPIQAGERCDMARADGGSQGEKTKKTKKIYMGSNFFAD